MELVLTPITHSHLLSIFSMISIGLRRSPQLYVTLTLLVLEARWMSICRDRLVYFILGVYLLRILSICPWLSLFHAHRQKSYSLQKPIRQAGHQIIEVVISPRERQLVVMVSEAAPNKIRTLCLLQPFPEMDRIWNNMDMSGVHLEQAGGPQCSCHRMGASFDVEEGCQIEVCTIKG